MVVRQARRAIVVSDAMLDLLKAARLIAALCAQLEQKGVRGGIVTEAREFISTTPGVTPRTLAEPVHGDNAVGGV